MSRTSETEASGIGARLMAARQRLGWSREALAFHSGISWSAIAQVESGRRRNVRPHTLSALSGALGVSIDYLVHGGSSSPMLEHQALLYETDEELLDTVAPFLTEGVERWEPSLVVTTSANIELLRERLGSDAERVEFVESKSWLTAPASALDAYEQFVNAQIEAGAPWVRIVGEPIWKGRSDSEVRLWTRFESLFNLAFAAAPVTLICLYDQRSISPEVAAEARLTHPHTIGEGGIASSPDYSDPGGFVLGP
jgi:transcriptional regulator with XRE-family HTH domain